jgi:hypothetical protein
LHRAADYAMLFAADRGAFMRTRPPTGKSFSTLPAPAAV